MNQLTKPIIVEEVYNNSIDQVWRSITELNQLKQWFFESITSFQPIKGFKTQFEVISNVRKFTHNWEITEVIPNKKIAYRWNYLEYSGDSFVTFELKKIKAKQTSLKLTHTVTENFPEGIPEFLRESGIQGWNYFIKQNLKEYLKELNS